MRIPRFELERFFAEYEFSTPYLLCASDCESMSVSELLAFEPDAEEAFRELRLGYTESPGHPALRAAVAGLYEGIGADDVLVHAGAEEAIFNFANSVLAPGDHVIVHTPCYQSLLEVPRAAGCEVSAWTAQEDDGWSLSLDALERLIRPNTRAVIVNLPHNPTGYLMAPAAFARLVEILRAHGAILFCDEVYRLLEHDAADRLPAACDSYENAVSLGVMSKSYGLAGLRIGWIATRNREIYQAMAGFKDYTTICSSAPSEFLATLALRHGERIVARNRHIIEGNIVLLDGFFERWKDAFSWNRPKAGPVAFPRYDGDGGVEALCRDLVAAKGVLLAPAYTFGHGERHFRVGFGRRNLAEALARFEAHLTEIA